MNEPHAPSLGARASPPARKKEIAGETPALPGGHIRLARPPSTRKKSFLSGGLCGARSADSLAVKDVEARGNHDRRSDQRIGVRHIAEYRIAERDNPDELAIDE